VQDLMQLSSQASVSQLNPGSPSAVHLMQLSTSLASPAPAEPPSAAAGFVAYYRTVMCCKPAVHAAASQNGLPESPGG